MNVIYNIFASTEQINSASGKVAVVIFTCKPKREPIVYSVDGVDDIEDAVFRAVNELTVGCNYRFEFMKRVDNVFFYK